MPELIVRPYQKSDREAVFRIGADTAFFGAPIEAYMEDRNIFLDVFYAYYIDVEPEHTWVAAVDQQVVGFITGCVNTRLQNRKYISSILPRLIGNFFRGKYHIGKQTLAYAWGIFVGFLRREFPHADLNKYPAHLHINVDSTWRGYKLGQRLMQAYLDQLKSLDVKGVYLDTTNLNEAACRMYEKFGFRILDSRPFRFWSRRFGKPVMNLCYGLRLQDGAVPAR